MNRNRFDLIIAHISEEEILDIIKSLSKKGPPPEAAASKIAEIV